MEFLSPEYLRVAVLGLLINTHQLWRRAVAHIVPGAYLDEIFHVPQAQSYWRGNWSRWDDKITTPPGLYVFSYGFNVVRRGRGDELSTDDLRNVNAILLYVLLVVLNVWSAMSRRARGRGSGGRSARMLHKEDVIIMFPLFFFFSVLYYTDLFSVVTVMLADVAWVSGLGRARRKWMCQLLQTAIGLVALTARQTNIFWVAVFSAGLQVFETVRTQAVIHDPDVSDMYIEGVCKDVLKAAWSDCNRYTQDVFLAFVSWNGGVVLGDKSNHVATIHMPQMLYLWPFIVFFSWPVLLPHIARWRQTRLQLPRPGPTCIVIVLMVAAVHYNTMVHPFTLADNRHYVFYVFRILMRPWWIKYAAVPVYFVCAWLAITALSAPTPHVQSQRVKSSFVIVWLVSTGLSLVSAPLVEPRYFIVPWLLWRLYVPDVRMMENVSGKKEKESGTGTPTLDHIVQVLAAWSLWIELLWYLTINIATCWLFLYKGFEWPQEPAKVQRFMW